MGVGGESWSGGSRDQLGLWVQGLRTVRGGPWETGGCPSGCGSLWLRVTWAGVLERACWWPASPMCGVPGPWGTEDGQPQERVLPFASLGLEDSRPGRPWVVMNPLRVRLFSVATRRLSEEGAIHGSVSPTGPLPWADQAPSCCLCGQVRKLCPACLAFHVASCALDVAPRRLGEGDPRSLRTHTRNSQGPDCPPWTGHWEPRFALTLGSQARGSVWVTLGSRIPSFLLTPFLLGAIPLVGTRPQDRGIALVGGWMEFCSQTLADLSVGGQSDPQPG